MRYIHGGMSDSKNGMVFTNLLGTDDPSVVAQLFARNDEYRPARAKNRMYHSILSFSPKDSAELTKPIIRDLVEEYIRLRCPEALVYGALHDSENHMHVHLAISGVDFMSERTTRLTRSQFYQIRQDLESYQKEHYPQLMHSLVYQKGRQKKLTLSEKIHKAYKKSFTLDDFKTYLKSVGRPYERKEKLHGVIVGKRKHRLSTNGITPEMIARLEKNQERMQEISQISNKRKRHIIRGI